MAKRKKSASLFDDDGGDTTVDTRGPGGGTEGVALHEAAQDGALGHGASDEASAA